MDRIYLILLSFFALVYGALGQSVTPLYNSKLLSPMNGNGHALKGPTPKGPPPKGPSGLRYADKEDRARDDFEQQKQREDAGAIVARNRNDKKKQSKDLPDDF